MGGNKGKQTLADFVYVYFKVKYKMVALSPWKLSSFKLEVQKNTCLTLIPFLKCLIRISRLTVEAINDKNLFTESNLANWFSSYVQFCSGGHF